MEDWNVTDEMLHAQHNKIVKLIAETETIILGESLKSNNDWYAHWLNCQNYYELTNLICKTRIEKIAPRLKVPCKYEIFAVLQVLAISIGAMSEQDLLPADECNRFYDPAWIKELSVSLHEHYRKTALKNYGTV